MKASIWQVKDGYQREWGFLSLESLGRLGGFDSGKYEKVYTYEVEDDGGGNVDLEGIYRTFNIDRPSDFRGHSLSTGDVVVLEDIGEAYYCDDIGWKQVDFKAEG